MFEARSSSSADCEMEGLFSSTIRNNRKRMRQHKLPRSRIVSSFSSSNNILQQQHREKWKNILLGILLLCAQPTCSEGSSSNGKSPGVSQNSNILPSISSQPELAGAVPSVWAFEDDDDDDDTSDDGDVQDDSDSSDSDAAEAWVPFGGGYPASPWEENAVQNRPANSQSIKQAEQNNPKAAASVQQKKQVPSQPLQTLEKLQQMLEETDYMTSRGGGPSQVGQQQQQQQQHPYHDHNLQQDFAALSDPPPLPTNQLELIPQYTSGSPPPLEPPPPPPHRHQEKPQQPSTESPLWTSKDRSKYKRQQKRLSLKGKSPQSSASDDEASDTDDGLEYILPNLPVYLSDAEGESDMEDYIHPRQGPVRHPPPPPPPHQGPGLRPDQTGAYPPYPPPPPQGSYLGPRYPQEAYPPGQEHYPQASSYQASTMPPPNPYGAYPYPPPPYNGPYDPRQNQGQPAHPQQQQQQQQDQQFYAAQQHYAAWAAAMGYAPPPQRYGPSQPQGWAQTPPSSAVKQSSKVPKPPTLTTALTKEAVASPYQSMIPTPSLQQQRQAGSQYDVTITVQSQSLAEATSRINFDSIQKVSLIMAAAAMFCYCSVSPRSLPQVEYNRLFYNNVRLVALALIAPLFTFFSVFDVGQNDLNEVIHSLYTSFSLGYVLCFGLEIFWTTLIRLSVFLCFEPEIFDMVPKIPVIILPWILRDVKYRPQRITIMAADVLTSCVACPLVEEYIKLKILQWTTRLPKNYAWVKKPKSSKTNNGDSINTSSGKKAKKSKWKREKVAPRPGDKEVTSVNKYVTQMLAVSIGLKLADSGRRVLMYTKPEHVDKGFYAICRGVFPIQELCGTMTALRLARRDVLGAEMATWWILAPAVIIHAMANLRGKKAVFKWGSATPWSEMQIFPWSSTDASTLPQLASKGFSKLMWLIIILRVLGFCAKNYYYSNRQAEKRTTTYAGNPSAIDAALASSDLLKKTQKSK